MEHNLTGFAHNLSGYGTESKDEPSTNSGAGPVKMHKVDGYQARGGERVDGSLYSVDGCQARGGERVDGSKLERRMGRRLTLEGRRLTSLGRRMLSSRRRKGRRIPSSRGEWVDVSLQKVDGSLHWVDGCQARGGERVDGFQARGREWVDVSLQKVDGSLHFTGFFYND